MTVDEDFRRAQALLENGERDAARATCEAIVAAVPAHAGALHLLGAIALRAGDHQVAADLLGRAAAAEGEAPAHHFALGNALKAQGELEGAEAAYRRTIALNPRHPSALVNLANLLGQTGRGDEAIAGYRRALDIEPGFALARNNLGNALAARGELDAAIACFRRALQDAPDDARAHNNLGVALKRHGRPDEAAGCYRKAIELSPGFAEARANLGSLLQDSGDWQGARTAYDRALELEALPGIAVKRAILLPVVYESTAEIAAVRGRLAASIEALAGAGTGLADPHREVGTTVFLLAYQAMNDRELQQAIARFYLKACPSLAWQAPAPARRAGGRLRVGFISGHFRDHAISWCYRGLMARLGREHLEVVVFTPGGGADAVTGEIRAVANRAVALPDDLAKARAAIADEALDILVYTDIGMEPLTYFLAFARLAPVQCVLPGHPDTTGIPNLDYFLSSALAEPDDADDHYSETLVRLSGGMIHYARPAPPPSPRSRESFGFGPDDHLYACPQTLYKLHPDFDAVLAAILRRDAAARIVLVEGKAGLWAETLRRRFATAMPDVAGRIHWLPWLAFDDFLALLMAADVLLEPLHFGGTNTSYQAFAFARPVVTLPGAFLRGRVTYALYRLMGVMDCVAKDADDYVDIAVHLATDGQWRRKVEARIAENVAIIYESPSAARSFADFITRAVERYRTGQIQPSDRR